MKAEKIIAVFMPQIYAEFVRNLRKGIEKEAKKRGFRLLFLTSLMDNTSFAESRKANDNFNEGESAVFYLVDFSEIDAVIMLYDSFAYVHWKELFHVIKKRCRCPIINFRTPLKGAYNIYVDDDISFAHMVQHFITVHQLRRINLLTGPEDNIHSIKRLEIYKRVLEQNQIPYEAFRVFYGNFWRNCGEQAVDAFIQGEGEVPEGIICANDYMAISVIQALQERGISVPEQVLVSGYDNIEESMYYVPSLTTVQQPVESMGRKAVEMVEQILAGEQVEQEIYLPSEIVCRQSCGCEKCENKKEQSYSSALMEHLNEMAALETTATTMITFMSNAPDFDSWIECVKEYALQDTGFEDFAICLATDWNQQILSPKTKKACQELRMEMVLGMLDGEQLEREKFSMQQFFPKIFYEKWNKPYYIFPLHYLQYFFGYAIVTIQKDVPNCSCIKAWFTHLDSALENIRIREKMALMVDELQKLYNKDTLTGLYNRRGLEQQGMEYYNYCRENNVPLMVMEIDMDGLKHINDSFGHMEGDIGLITISRAMIACSVEQEICIRSGGDEFVIIGKDYDQKKLDQLIQSFDDFMRRVNERSQKSYQFAASVGYYMAIPDEQTDLEEFLKIADAAMYEEKKRHKAMRV